MLCAAGSARRDKRGKEKKKRESALPWNAAAAARSKFLQGTSLRARLFSSRAELKIATGLDRDPEIDRGHHSYKRLTIQEYSVCTAWSGERHRCAPDQDTAHYKRLFRHAAAARVDLTGIDLNTRLQHSKK